MAAGGIAAIQPHQALAYIAGVHGDDDDGLTQQEQQRRALAYIRGIHGDDEVVPAAPVANTRFVRLKGVLPLFHDIIANDLPPNEISNQAMQALARTMGFRISARSRDELFRLLRALICELIRRGALRTTNDGDAAICQGLPPYDPDSPLYSNSRITQNSLLSGRLIPSELRRANLLRYAKNANIEIPPTDRAIMGTNEDLANYLTDALRRRMDSFANLFSPQEAQFIRARIMEDARTFRPTRTVY